MLAIPLLPKYHLMYHTLMYSSSSLEGLSVFTILSSVCLNQLRIDQIPSPNNHFKSICILFQICVICVVLYDIMIFDRNIRSMFVTMSSKNKSSYPREIKRKKKKSSIIPPPGVYLGVCCFCTFVYLKSPVNISLQ